ncbi:MAG: DUF2807 domain-containing protein [Alistipes sp.]|nr:DUF2807 domain-containing protein [Alistipes sp.]
MKKLFSKLAILLTAIVATLFVVDANAQGISFGSGKNQIKGSKTFITEERTVPTDYEGIQVSHYINVLISPNDGDKATITANDNLMQYIKIEQKGDVLKIYLDNAKVKSFSNISIDVRLPKNEKLKSIKATSAANVKVGYKLDGSNIDADASSAGEITFDNIKAKEIKLNSSSASKINIKESNVANMTIEASSAAEILVKTKAQNIKSSATSAAEVNIYTLCTNISVEGSSSADIKLSGKAKNFTANASSATDINAEELEVDGVADLKASSGAEIEAWCNGKLIANASSGADIDWRGKASAEVSKSSGGSVSKK